VSYDEWIQSLEILKNTNNKEIKEKLVSEEYNPNIADKIETKVLELIDFKLNKAIKSIISSIGEMLSNSFSLDMFMIEFKKKVLFIDELLNIKQISVKKKELAKENLKNETEKVYNILIKESRGMDPYGIFETTIKNNKIKWS
jgi:hypothetical protein